MKKYFYLFLLATCSLLTVSCSVNPVSGKKQLSFMSETQELAIGKENDPAVIAQLDCIRMIPFSNLSKKKAIKWQQNRIDQLYHLNLEF